MQTFINFKKCSFFFEKGLVQETEPDFFVLVEDEEFTENHTSHFGGSSTCPTAQDTSLVTTSCIEDEAESVMASSHDQRQEELHVRPYKNFPLQFELICF